jgi:hypothetical protein
MKKRTSKSENNNTVTPPKEKQVDSTVKAALITAAAGIITALVTYLIGPAVLKVLDTPSTMIPTQTTLSTVISPTIQVPSETPLATITPQAVVVSQLTWFGHEIDNSYFRATNEFSKFDFHEQMLIVSGIGLDDRIWVGLEQLPSNTRITLTVQISEGECGFSVGFGDGENYKPDYHLTVSSTGTYFLKNRAENAADDNWQKYYYQEHSNPIKVNTPSEIDIRRQASEVTVLINGRQEIFVSPSEEEMEDINTWNRLFLVMYGEEDGSCQATITKLVVEALY